MDFVGPHAKPGGSAPVSAQVLHSKRGSRAVRPFTQRLWVRAKPTAVPSGNNEDLCLSYPAPVILKSEIINELSAFGTQRHSPRTHAT